MSGRGDIYIKLKRLMFNVSHIMLLLPLLACLTGCRAARAPYVGEYRYDHNEADFFASVSGQLSLSARGRWVRYGHGPKLCYGTGCCGPCMAARDKGRLTDRGRWRPDGDGVVLRRGLRERSPMWLVSQDGSTYLITGEQRAQLCAGGALEWDRVFRRLSASASPAPSPAELCTGGR